MNDDTSARASYSADQFAPLFAAEDRHFWFRSRNRCISAALRTLPDFQTIKNILEVGCGTGFVLAELQRLFPNGRVVGMDLFEEALAFARKRFSGTLVRGDVFEQQFDQRFDLIGAFDVIEHLDDDERILRRFWQQLEPGGHLIITVPAHMRLWSYFDDVAHHRRRYELAGLEEKLARADFNLVLTTPFMAALYPVMWLKRKLLGERASSLSKATPQRQQAAVESDLEVPSLVNWALHAALRPDAYCIARRKRLPFGTSLLAVATKPVYALD